MSDLLCMAIAVITGSTMKALLLPVEIDASPCRADVRTRLVDELLWSIRKSGSSMAVHVDMESRKSELFIRVLIKALLPVGVHHY
jgi:hypothetical protein